MVFLLFLVLYFVGLVIGIVYLERRRAQTITRSFPDGNSATGGFVFDSIIAKILLRKNFVAIAIGNYVFVKATSTSETIIMHELRHVYQWQSLGFFRFIWEYLTENYRYGYTCNRFEEDARLFAGQPLRCSGEKT